MGGKRFTDHEVERLPADAYRQVEAIVINRLAELGIPARTQLSFPDKESFGDMDVLVTYEDVLAHAGEASQTESPKYRATKHIGNYLGAIAMATSGERDHATSFVLPTPTGALFQVDLILHPREAIDYAFGFYSWGDAGALTSVTARALGLRNKATGLHYVAGPDSDQIDVPLPVTYGEALELMGLDAQQHAAGFASQQEVFDWLRAGREFDPSIYRVEYLTQKSRRRSRLRPMQVAFQQICAGLSHGNASHPLKMKGQAKAERYAQMESYRNRWRALFPHLVQIEADHCERFAQRARQREFFSSASVAEHTGLEGEALNQMMWQITKHPSFQAAINAQNQEALDVVIADVEARLLDEVRR